jgi:hypothetical protein
MLLCCLNPAALQVAVYHIQCSGTLQLLSAGLHRMLQGTAVLAVLAEKYPAAFFQNWVARNGYLVVAAAFGLLAWPKRCLTPHTAGDVLAALTVDTGGAARSRLRSWLRLHDTVSMPVGTCKRRSRQRNHLLPRQTLARSMRAGGEHGALKACNTGEHISLLGRVA